MAKRPEAAARTPGAPATRASYVRARELRARDVRARELRARDLRAACRKDAPRTMRDLRLATESRRRTPAAKPLDNPLREGLRLERVPEPAVFVLFGATGDLAHRKVIPALFQLWRTHLLPHEFTLVAVGRRPYTDETFRRELKESLDRYSRVQPVDAEAWDDLASRIVYHRGDFADPAAYTSLARAPGRPRPGRTAPAATGSSTWPRNRRRSRRSSPRSAGWAWTTNATKAAGAGSSSRSRSGGTLTPRSASTARSGRSSGERQVYRIDHYLGKETVRNLLVFRFGNGIFEPIWNRRHIDHVQITVAESIGIESRGAFYEETGASRDVLQNHLLQLLSLVAMEPPATFEADALRDEKVKVIRAVGRLTPEQARRDVVRGQYGPGWVSAKPVPGYRAEPDVDPASETETYIAARLTIDDWRWSGVPFFLRMGKRLPKRATEIAIQFKEVPHQLFRDSAADPEPNLLAMRIQPDEGIMLRFGAKVPGLGIDVRNVTMDFTYGSAFQTDSPDAYETLILDVLLGDASLFTRADEVEEAWSIVDPIVAAWAEQEAPPSRTTRRARGVPRPPTTFSPARADGGAGSRPPRPGRRSRARSSPSGRGRAAAGGSSRSRRSRPGEPMLRWLSRARTIDDIETELARIWAQPNLMVDANGERRGRYIAARTSVMNLVVIAQKPEVGEWAAEIISRLAGRHPSRTMVVLSADPDGPPWLDARIEAHCVLPRPDAPEMCSEVIHLTAGGETGPTPDRAGGPAAHPRPAGDRLVARRAAAGLGPHGRAAGHRRPPRGGRFGLVR